jgi:fructokinase
MSQVRIGIDLGGTKTEIVALDRNGKEILRERTPTPSQSYTEIIAMLADLIFQSERKIGQTCTVGIGVPGAISPATGLIKNSNTLCLIGQPLDKDLSEILERPVRLANDANCFALSEASDGAGAGSDVVFGVILGTGVGGGVVVHGKVLSGPNAIAGEWGHNPLPWPLDSERPGPLCYCGKNGCIETFLSGPGLARDHLAVEGISLSSEQIAAATLGDSAAEATLIRYELRLARALASVINVIDPDVIVLGGGLSNLDRLYQSIPSIWGQFVFSDRVDTRLVRAKYGDSSGVRGAAWLWPKSLSLIS